MNWHIKDHNRTYGPYSQEMMIQFVREKKFTPQHLVSQNQHDWYTVAQFIQMTMQKTRQQQINQSKEQTQRMQQDLQATREFTDNRKMLGKYEIISELGRGGMGIVYHCRDSYLGRECAVKVILGIDDERSKKRFFAEAKAIAELDHPNVIRIQDMGEFTDYNGVSRSLFAMDYVKGQTLETLIQENKLTLRQKLEIFRQVCDGMAHAHERKIIHRDLKPVNILVTESLTPIILDFGFARKIDVSSEITKTGDIFGTPRYMAPESISGKKTTDVKSDIYALGVILYKLLAGRTPFSGDDIMGVLFEITTKEPILPSVLNPEIKKDSDIEIICLKCLEKNPAKRMESVELLKTEIENIIAHKPIVTKPIGIIEKYRKKFKYDKDFQRVVLPVPFLVLIIFFVYLQWEAALKGERTAKEERKKTEIQKQIAEKQTQIANFQSFVKDITTTRRNVDEAAFQKVFTDLRIYQNTKNKDDTAGSSLSTVEMLDNFFDKKLYKEDIAKEKISEFFSLLRFSVLPNLPHIKNILEISTSNKMHLTHSHNLKYLSYLDTANGNMILQTQGEKIPTPFALKPGESITPFSFSKNERFLVFRHTFPLNNHQKTSYHRIFDISRNKVLPFELDVDYRSHKKSILFSDDSKYLAYNAPGAFYIIYLEEEKQQQVIDLYAKDFAFSKDYVAYFPDTNNYNDKFYYIYDLALQKSKKIGKIEKVGEGSINSDYHNNIFFIDMIDIVQFFTIKTIDSIEVENVINLAQNVSKNASQISISTNGNLALAMKKEILFLNKISAKGELYFYHNHKKLPAQIEKIEFMSPHILVSRAKGDNIYLLDILSRSFLYQQKNAASFYPANNNTLIFVSKAIKNNNPVSLYSYFYWEKKLLTIYGLTERALKDYKVIKKSFQFDESSIKSDQILVSQIGKIKTIILPLTRGLAVWQESNGVMRNNLIFSPLTDIFDIAMSSDQTQLAVLLNDKKHSPCRQTIVLVDILNLLDNKENIFNKKPIISEQTTHTGHFIKLNSNSGYKRYREICNVAFSNDDQNLYVSYDTEMLLYSIKKGNTAPFIQSVYRPLIIKNNKHLVAIAQESGGVSIVDSHSKKQWNKVFEIDSFNNQQKGDAHIIALDWHPSGKIIAFGNVAGQVRLLKYSDSTNDWENMLSLREEEQVNFGEEIYNLSFSPDGKYLAIFTFENIYIYDVEHKYYVESYVGYHKGGTAIFTDDWKQCLLPSIDSEIMVFDQEYFIDDDKFAEQIKEPGYEVYFKDNKSSDIPNNNYWPLRLQQKFKDFMK